MTTLGWPKSAVVSETVEGEAIVINLLNGHYHRLTGVAAELWDELKEPVAFDRWSQRAAEISPELRGCDLARFAAELAAAGLVTLEGDDAATLESLARECAADEPARLVLESYDDMADMILLDPIHEVGEYGWPLRPAET